MRPVLSGRTKAGEEAYSSRKSTILEFGRPALGRFGSLLMRHIPSGLLAKPGG